MAAHRYWRYRITATTGSWVAIRRIDLREADGGPLLTTYYGGTAFGDSRSGYVPANAFDGDYATEWQSQNGGWFVPAVAGWDFGAGNGREVNHLTIQVADSPSAMPMDYPSPTLQYSDDGITYYVHLMTPGITTAINAVYTFGEPSHSSFALEAPNSLGFSRTRFVSSASVALQGISPVGIMKTASGARVELYGLMPKLKIVAHDTTGENVLTGSIGAPSLYASGGGNATAAIALGTMDITGTFTGLGSAELRGPRGFVTASGAVTATGAIAIGLPSIPKLIGYFGGVLSVSLTGKPTVSAQGTTGGVGSIRAKLPLFELTAMGTVNGRSSAELVSPMPGVGPTARAWLTSPMGKLTAIGSAVVSVAYEAYALNIKHHNPESPDELTRFTNYPFDRIIRYKNSYFGSNSTGLYLLEGTTDYAEPAPKAIPWEFKTAMTDFGNPYIKNVASVYFAGRLGPEATIDLHVGEDGAKTYSYKTPRTSTAKNFRQKFGRGNDARYYALGASGEGELALDEIQFNILNQSRRI